MSKRPVTDKPYNTLRDELQVIVKEMNDFLEKERNGSSAQGYFEDMAGILYEDTGHKATVYGQIVFRYPDDPKNYYWVFRFRNIVPLEEDFLQKGVEMVLEELRESRDWFIDNIHKDIPTFLKEIVSGTFKGHKEDN